MFANKIIGTININNNNNINKDNTISFLLEFVPINSY